MHISQPILGMISHIHTISLALPRITNTYGAKDAAEEEFDFWKFPEFDSEVMEHDGLFDSHVKSIAGVSEKIAVGK